MRLLQKVILFLNENKKQLLIFVFVGFINTIVDFSIYMLFKEFLHVYFLVSKIFSFIIASMCSFLLNKKYTFQSNSKTTKEISRFYIIACLGLLINASGMKLFYGVLMIDNIVSFLLATGLAIIFSFSFNKYWVFKNKV